MLTSAPRLIRNPISLLGVVVTTFSALLFLVVFLLDLFGLHTNPYLGIVFFLILPGFFIGGLLLIPLGMWLERRRRAAGHAPRTTGWPRIDLNDPVHRRTAAIALALTLANVVIVSLAAYRGIHFMDSVQFCGQVCHEVMEPEFVAYQDGAHSRVACVQCHIGPGAPWFVKSKFSGTRQVFAVLLNTHSRPIKSPVHDLRPARDTCEQCHWPEKFHGDKAEIRRSYADDEAVTETATNLRIHVGGGSEKMGIAAGIHWQHMDVTNEVEYIASDDRRQVIPYVRVKDRTGRITEFVVDGTPQDVLDRGERRRMDCVDCHNRASHPFAASAEREVDRALAGGELPKLPYVRREAVSVLKVAYPDRSTAESEISGRLNNFYRTEYAEVYTSRRPEIDRAVQVVQRLYGRDIFPKMNVTWGTHPNNIGHMDAPGCFRCHDDNHKSKDGRDIRQDCDQCHEIS